jgi:hypothetical protein
MEDTTRRKFCGTAILAIPALAVIGKAKTTDIDNDFSAAPDSIFNSLADEFTRITVDGAQNGFKSEHFRRYAGFMRVFDAQMESKGINRETDKKLDEDDFYKLNPMRSAKLASDFWRKRRIEIREDELTERLTMDWKIYNEWKKAIKKQGGVRALHARVAIAFEQKAKEYETSTLRNGPFIRQGRIEFPRREEQAAFVKAQYIDPDRLISEFVFEGVTIPLPLVGDAWSIVESIGFNINYHCLCRAMIVEGAILSLACLLGLCLPCCAPGAILLAAEKLLEGLGLCSPTKC